MPRILIAGAGIGGLTAALTLAQIGASVVILERAPALEEIGAGLQLSPNACRILRRLGVLDSVAASAFRPSCIRVRSARTGGTLSVLPLDDVEQRWGAPYLVVRRADLQAALVAAVAAEPGIALHLGTALAGFGTTPRGVTVTAAQGALKRGFEGDVLIGADGVRSTVRARLLDGAPDKPTETGRTAWRSIVETEDPMFAALETGLWLGRDAHLVHYPLGGSLINVVAITRDTSAADPQNLWSKPGDLDVIAKRFAVLASIPPRPDRVSQNLDDVALVRSGAPALLERRAGCSSRRCGPSDPAFPGARRRAGDRRCRRPCRCDGQHP